MRICGLIQTHTLIKKRKGQLKFPTSCLFQVFPLASSAYNFHNLLCVFCQKISTCVHSFLELSTCFDVNNTLCTNPG